MSHFTVLVFVSEGVFLQIVSIFVTLTFHVTSQTKLMSLLCGHKLTEILI